jgi:hypothetical protein
MPKLTAAIPPQAFEIIRNRIADILIDEFTNQHTISNDEDLNLEFTLESSSPVDKTDPPLINVSFNTADFSNKNQGSADGTYIYSIDCYTTAKSDDDAQGDSKSSVKVQRLAGMCYAILTDPQYRNLGFTPPFIIRTTPGQINIAEPAKKDAASIMMARFSFTVMANQINPLIVPTLIEGYDTKVKIGTSEVGYKYSGETYI